VVGEAHTNHRGTEGGFQKVFGKSVGWTGYSHRKTGELAVERLRRVQWIRPVWKCAFPNQNLRQQPLHEAPRERPACPRRKKRLFITTSTGLLYFISLVYIEHGLALGTAFEPDGQWLREMLKKHGTMQLSS